MKRVFIFLCMLSLTSMLSAYDKGLFDLDVWEERPKSYYTITELDTDNKPGLESHVNLVIEFFEANNIQSYRIFDLPQRAITASFKAIEYEGYSTKAYKAYSIVFCSTQYSTTGVMVLMKFDTDGSAWLVGIELW